MKNSLFLFLFVLISTICKSQQTHKLSVELSGGLSLAVGNYAGKSYNTVPFNEIEAGWAKPGPAIQLSLNYDITRLYGVSFLAGWQENNEDGSIVKDTLISRTPGYDHYNVNAKTWMVWKILAGGFLNLPLANKLSIKPKVLFGILKTSYPGYSYLVYNDATNPNPSGGPYSGSLGGPTLPWSFCYQLGATLQKDLNEKIFLTASADFFHAAPAWKYSGYNPISGLVVSGKATYPVASIVFLVGVGYRF